MSLLFPADFEVVPADLCQKITIINKNLVIGWAGSAIHAKAVIRLLQEDATHSATYGQSDLFRLLANSGVYDPNEVAFLALVSDGKRIYRQSFGDFDVKTYPAFGKVHTAGSGRHDLDQLLSMQDVDLAAVSGNIDDLGRDIASVYQITSQLNANEINNGLNLYWYYGGCYEIVARWGDAFQKVPEVTYVSWSLERHEDGLLELIFTGLITKHFYVRDLLVVRRAKLIVSKEGIEDIFEELIVVPPVVKPAPFDECMSLPDYASRLMCSNVYFYDEVSKALTAVNMITLSPADTLAIRTRYSDGKLIGFEFNARYIESLKSFISRIAGCPDRISICTP